MFILITAVAGVGGKTYDFSWGALNVLVNGVAPDQPGKETRLVSKRDCWLNNSLEHAVVQVLASRSLEATGELAIKVSDLRSNDSSELKLVPQVKDEPIARFTFKNKAGGERVVNLSNGASELPESIQPTDDSNIAAHYQACLRLLAITHEQKEKDLARARIFPDGEPFPSGTY